MTIISDLRAMDRVRALTTALVKTQPPTATPRLVVVHSDSVKVIWTIGEGEESRSHTVTYTTGEILMMLLSQDKARALALISDCYEEEKET